MGVEGEGPGDGALPLRLSYRGISVGVDGGAGSRKGYFLNCPLLSTLTLQL